jgi:hypothetical protein
MAQVPDHSEKDGEAKTASVKDFPPCSTVPSPFAQGSNTHSVLDAQLEALSLGNDLASLLLSSKTVEGLEVEVPFFKRKGPNSLPGTGSSIASASDHEVSSSDFESDSGIENSHTEVHSPEMSVGLSKQQQGQKKGVEPYLDVMPHDDLAVVTAASASDTDQSEKSCDRRIESFIQCLDDKVRSLFIALLMAWLEQ